MKYDRIEMKFDPIAVKETFFDNKASINQEEFIYNINMVPFVGTADNAPPALKLMWELKAEYKKELGVIEATANDLFTIQDTEDYKSHSGGMVIKEIIVKSFLEFKNGFLFAKNHLQLPIPPIPPISEERTQEAIKKVRELMDKKIG